MPPVAISNKTLIQLTNKNILLIKPTAHTNLIQKSKTRREFAQSLNIIAETWTYLVGDVEHFFTHFKTRCLFHEFALDQVMCYFSFLQTYPLTHKTRNPTAGTHLGPLLFEINLIFCFQHCFLYHKLSVNLHKHSIFTFLANVCSNYLSDFLFMLLC